MTNPKPKQISTLLLQQRQPEPEKLPQTGNYRLAIGCTGHKQKTTPPALIGNDGVEFNSPHQT